MSAAASRDYSLTGPSAAQAVEQHLAGAEWYACPLPAATMRDLLARRDDYALRDTALWFALLGLFGWLGYLAWPHWYALLPFALYGVLYGSSSDSRWHESLHGTAFKTDWLNNALYEIASFMVQRESTVWRWSHTRHHSDTIIVGRDPEIAVPRPPRLGRMVAGFLGVPTALVYFRKLWIHAAGYILPDEATFIPADAYRAVYLKARLYLAIYATVLALGLWHHSLLPLMFIGLPNLYGHWLMPIYGYTQHAGLAEDVLDHRLCCRTVYMNRVNRFLYWNMNYHIEHHMFPLVPYHQLPRLHELVKADMPPAYDGLLAAWREIVPAVLRQVKEPDYFVERPLPRTAARAASGVVPQTFVSDGTASADGWLDIAPADALTVEDVLRFDVGERTFAVYRAADGQYYATDGVCTHGRAHLATGLVQGHQIECPKHNGRFDVRDGSPQRAPVCVGLATHTVRVVDGRLQLLIGDATL